MKRSVARRMLLYPSMLLGITAMVLTQSFVVMATETPAVQETETVTETGTTNTVDVQNTANETDSGTGAGTEAESDADSDPAPTIAEQIF